MIQVSDENILQDWRDVSNEISLEYLLNTLYQITGVPKSALDNLTTKSLTYDTRQ